MYYSTGKKIFSTTVTQFFQFLSHAVLDRQTHQQLHVTYCWLKEYLTKESKQKLKKACSTQIDWGTIYFKASTKFFLKSLNFFPWKKVVCPNKKNFIWIWQKQTQISTSFLTLGRNGNTLMQHLSSCLTRSDLFSYVVWGEDILL